MIHASLGWSGHIYNSLNLKGFSQKLREKIKTLIVNLVQSSKDDKRVECFYSTSRNILGYKTRCITSNRVKNREIDANELCGPNDKDTGRSPRRFAPQKVKMWRARPLVEAIQIQKRQRYCALRSVLCVRRERRVCVECTPVTEAP